MTYKNLVESLKYDPKTDIMVHHYTNGSNEEGSFNRDKIEKMAKGAKIKTTPLASYNGHLMCKEYN